MHALDPGPHMQHGQDRSREESHQFDVRDQSGRAVDPVQADQQGHEDHHGQDRLRRHPAQRNVRHDGRREDREQPTEQIAFGVLGTHKAREISGGQKQREGRNDNQQPLRPDRPLPDQQGCGREVKGGQDEAAHDDRLGQVRRHHERVDPDAQEVDQRDEAEPGAQTAAAPAPGRYLIAPLKLRRQPQ